MSYLQFSVNEANATPREARLLDLEPGLSLSEIARLARSFARNGVTMIRLAGGEPLLREEVVDIVETFARQSGIGIVAMTTDGRRLAQYAEPLLWAGLQRISVTLDSLQRETYHRLTGYDALPQALEGLEVARHLPFQHLCVKMTARRGINDIELPDFITYAHRTGLEVCFTELLPPTEPNAEWEAQFLPVRELRERLTRLGVIFPEGASPARGTLPGGGSIRVIAPVSEPSLRQWLHLHISADGRLTSLQAQTDEENLRPWVAAPDLDKRVREAIARTTTQVQQEMTARKNGAASLESEN